MKILLMLLAIATTATAQVDHPKALRALAETEYSAGLIGSAGEGETYNAAIDAAREPKP